MSFLSAFFKEILEDLIAYAIVIFLFVFYYFVVPDYWFLSGLMTIFVVGAVRFFRVYKK